MSIRHGPFFNLFVCFRSTACFRFVSSCISSFFLTCRVEIYGSIRPSVVSDASPFAPKFLRAHDLVRRRDYVGYVFHYNPQDKDAPAHISLGRYCKAKVYPGDIVAPDNGGGDENQNASEMMRSGSKVLCQVKEISDGVVLCNVRPVPLSSSNATQSQPSTHLAQSNEKAEESEIDENSDDDTSGFDGSDDESGEESEGDAASLADGDTSGFDDGDESDVEMEVEAPKEAKKLGKAFGKSNPLLKQPAMQFNQSKRSLCPLKKNGDLKRNISQNGSESSSDEEAEIPKRKERKLAKQVNRFPIKKAKK
jgi:hypothetical protein